MEGCFPVNVASRSGPVDHPAGELVHSTERNKAQLSRLARAGRALRLAPGIYVVEATLPAERVAHHHRLAIVARLWPGAVLCDRMAFSGAEPVEGWMFVCHPNPARRSDVHLPGMSVSVRVGPGPLPGDMPMPEGLYLSGSARGLVENITGGGRPAAGRPARAAGTAAVEDQIDELARTGGPGRIRNVLAQLDAVSGVLPAAAVALVRRRLAAVLGTLTPDAPSSPRLRARLDGQPYDEHRLEMVKRLVQLLGETAPVPRPALPPPGRWRWLAFFEAYFSNFIEGTEFGVEEARRIAIEGQIPAARPQDAHDVAATYRIASDAALASRTAKSGSDLSALLRDQHALLMAARPEKRPGRFKQQPNYAGGYQFVTPELVEGTLLRGFDCVGALTDPFQRAVALMLLITECHPFDDGNGRIARLIANGELSAAGQVRIVIPTIYRNNYLAGLVGVSNAAGRGETLVAVLAFAQKWTATIDWSSFEAADAALRALDAYTDPGVAETLGLRLRLPA